MGKTKNINGFTIVELIVAVSILVVLSTIGFISYENTLTDARNATRKSDMGNIKMSLKNHKLKNGSYPIPGNSFNITNSGNTIIKQGLLDENVSTQELVKKPTDPFVDGQYYFYSISNNKLFFQIAMSIEDDTIENDYSLRAYVDGDYQQVADMIPSIVFTSTSSGSIEAFSGKFIVDKGTLNLPYDENGDVLNLATSFTGIIGESGVSIPKFYGYYSCQEIYENGNSMGSGSYKILDNNGNVTSTGCLMNY